MVLISFWSVSPAAWPFDPMEGIRAAKAGEVIKNTM
jgi:hypothetical protein